MIYLGLDNFEKDQLVSNYCLGNSITKVFVFSPSKFKTTTTFDPHENIEYDQIIQYKYYYRLLQEIGKDTLLVINECLRTQSRHDLTYNCLRNFLNQTQHQLIFQYLPLIDTLEDFMILFDFDTRSQWKRTPWSAQLLLEANVVTKRIPLELVRVPVTVTANTKEAYAVEKRKLIDGIGLKDPHTIPRNLYLMSGRAKLDCVTQGQYYVGRNNRFKVPTLQTYREEDYPRDYTVFELCHNFIDFIDFLSLSRQARVPILVTDLKVDQWYFDRYQSWVERIRDAYSALQG